MTTLNDTVVTVQMDTRLKKETEFLLDEMGLNFLNG